MYHINIRLKVMKTYLNLLTFFKQISGRANDYFNTPGYLS